MANTSFTKNIYPAVTQMLPNREPIESLIGALERHDPALLEHGIRTASYSLVLGRLVNLTNNDMEDLYHAALLHDIGKMALPNEVIRQNGISIIGDYLMTECTPQASANMLRPWPALGNVATLIALHHERWDGIGLPFGLRGQQIPMGARILSLADTVDQLLTQKSDSFSAQATALVRILSTLSRSRFDPKLVNLFIEWFQDVFLETLVNYPWGEDSLVWKSDSTSTADILESAKLIHGIM